MNCAIVDIYKRVLGQGEELICEEDNTSNSPVYKISICNPRIKKLIYNNIFLGDKDLIKSLINTTWDFQAGKDPFISYDTFGKLQFSGSITSFPSLKIKINN